MGEERPDGEGDLKARGGWEGKVGGARQPQGERRGRGEGQSKEATQRRGVHVPPLTTAQYQYLRLMGFQEREGEDKGGGWGVSEGGSNQSFIEFPSHMGFDASCVCPVTPRPLATVTFLFFM